ncbi:hypothetical protein GCM10011514_22880 [Emticicia aquatilis]|uniref:Restriction endonuclease n=1 Tax=Emticicia aquatilis TaxID=1537369 RepID=A0A916YRN4_9BACT|nr:hypothetical protein [Emticicia aquatilis]GGD58293.1 hypothetical protein GCM10011514_22880 [Emticicia aquatilis]
MKLFDTFNRTNLEFKKHQQSTYDFYNQTARKEFAEIRERLEEWFQKYPFNNQKKLKNDLIKNGFNAAFYELFLYNYFYKLGFNIEIEPEVPNSSHRPDFLIFNDLGSFYLEATTVNGASEIETKREKIRSVVYDKINEFHSPNFYLDIQCFQIISGKAPSSKRIVNFIKDKLSAINNIVENSNHNFISWSYSDEDILMEIGVIPKPTKHKGQTESTTIGIYGGDGTAKIDRSTECINKSLANKSNRYGKLDRPYVIAINLLEKQSDFDTNLALYGTESFIYSKNSRELIKTIRNKDGFFYGKQGFQRKGVSAVLAGAVFPSNSDDFQLTIYHNIEPYYNFERGLIKEKHVYLEKDEQLSYYKFKEELIK